MSIYQASMDDGSFIYLAAANKEEAEEMAKALASCSERPERQVSSIKDLGR